MSDRAAVDPRRKRRHRAAAAALGAFGLTACGLPPDGTAPLTQSRVVENSVHPSGAGTLTVDGCALLDATSVFTQRIDSLPASTFSPGTDPIERAATMLRSVGMEQLRSGSSTKPFQNRVAGFPLNTVDGTTRSVLVGTPNTGAEAITVLFPAFGSTVNWQDEPNTLFGDRHLMVMDRSTCRLQEHISYNHTLKTSESAVEWSTPVVAPSVALRVDPDTGLPLPTRVDGADLPISPLVYRFDGVFPNGINGPVGEIHHALRLALPKDVNAAGAFVDPAAHADGTSTDPAAMPMGTRLRLRSDAFDRLTPTLSPGARVVIDALRHYGAVVADSTDPITSSTPGGAKLSGEYNPAWPAEMLTDIARVAIDDFEVVDTTCWSGTNRLVVQSPLPEAC